MNKHILLFLLLCFSIFSTQAQNAHDPSEILDAHLKEIEQKHLLEQEALWDSLARLEYEKHLKEWQAANPPTAQSNMTCDTSADRAALIALYNATDGANWTNTWDLNQSMSTWYGVMLNGDGCVIGLNLAHNKLTGTIPEQIGTLVNLTSLNLSVNKLTGNIPEQIENLVNLIGLWLNHNTLREIIPEQIGNLTNLVHLHLQSNQLTGTIPNQFYNLLNLKSLGLYGNQLSGIISTQIGNLSNLTSLSIQNNQLTGEIPEQIYNLVNLERLSLNGNQLEGSISQQISNLTNLTYLDLSFNQLSESIPNQIGSLINLTSLSLQNNQLIGEIPSQFGNLINLNRLDLSRNQLTGEIPAQIWNINNLTRLGLTNNQLTGEISTQIENLSNLTNLWLDGNNLTGEIPNQIGNLSNLEELYFSRNQLTGEIPNQIWELNNLIRLGLSSNQLTGEISAQIGNLTNLISLWLYDNNLTGEIPNQIGNLTELNILYLNNNQLTGNIPNQISNLIKLKNLSLHNNQINGIFPTQIINFSDLNYLGLYNNQLTSFPDFTGHSSDLFIDIDRNKLSFDDLLYNIEFFTNPSQYNPQNKFGETQTIKLIEGETYTISYDIDPDITNNTYEWYKNNTLITSTNTPTFNAMEEGVYYCKVTNPDLPALTLESHPISIEFFPQNNPDCDPSANRVALIALYNATDGANWTNTWDLSQPMSTWYGVTFNEDGCVQQLNLSDNQLSGSIPSEVGNLTNLTNLKLRNNQLSGEIPEQIGSLTNLTDLSLGINQLTGEIPEQIWNLTNLEFLNLRANQLTSNIPAQISNLINLKYLLLTGTQLTGEIPPQIGNLINLRHIDMQNNQLTGEIPPQIGNLTELQVLDLGHNQLTGSIPIQMEKLNKLSFLQLGSNQLTGEIPAEIGNLNRLTFLSLSDNQLQGRIPTQIENLTNLRRLQLDGNKLAGVIPNQITNFIYLERLSISSNQFTSFPDFTGHPSNLILTVRNNNLSFDDLLYNTEFFNLSQDYSPQNKFGEEATVLLPPGESYTISYDIDPNINNNEYRWFKNNTFVATTNTPTFQVTNAANNDVYHCEVTNPDLADLTLMSHNLTFMQDAPNCSGTLFLDNQPISPDTYQAEQNIVSGGTVATNTTVTFKAGQAITLKPNFEVQAGAEFLAIIETCQQTLLETTATERQALASTFEQNSTLQLGIAPNPFQQETTIQYTLPEAGKVYLQIFDLMGQQVHSLENGAYQTSGTHQFQLQAAHLLPGTYFIKLRCGKDVGLEKFIVLK